MRFRQYPISPEFMKKLFATYNANIEYNYHLFSMPNTTIRIVVKFTTIITNKKDDIRYLEALRKCFLVSRLLVWV